MKRFLGLKRTNSGNYLGGIEHLFPGLISGWVFGQAGEFHEVRLLVGSNMIARCEINQSRPDVCQQLRREGTPGFGLKLPGELPPLDWSQPARLLALSADGRQQAELQIPGKGVNTAQQLQELLRSDALGLEGHFDGVIDGHLQGWAAKHNQVKSAEIWMQGKDLEPFQVVCNKQRKGMESTGLPKHCAFQVNIDSLPSEWGSKSVWFTFDRAGKYRLAQNQKVVVPEKAVQPLAVATQVSYSDQGLSAPNELQQHWAALENFRVFLDGLEEELDRRDDIRKRASMQQSKNPGLLRKLINAVQR